MHALIKENNSTNAMIALAFLLAQFVGLVHAYEHEHDEHAQHECEICLVHTFYDDFTFDGEIVTKFLSGDRELALSLSSSIHIACLYFHQSRAPPVFHHSSLS